MVNPLQGSALLLQGYAQEYSRTFEMIVLLCVVSQLNRHCINLFDPFFALTSRASSRPWSTRLKQNIILLAILATSPTASALPPLFDAVPRVPAPSRVVASWPAGTFLESVIALRDGDLLVNSHLDGVIHRVTPSSGAVALFARIPGTIAGLASADDGTFIVSGWIDGTQPAIFHLSVTGEVKTLISLPEGQFPNGVTRLVGSRYLVADSYRGVIWEIDVATPSARVWWEDATLRRPNATNPVPGVNGLKINDGFLYFSNTQASTLHRLAITAEGQPTGEPILVAEPVNLDNFAFGPDGSIYGTTHVFNNVIRIEPATGNIAVVCETDVLGSTDAAFGVTPEDSSTLYVVGNGGLTLPPPEGVQPATVTALTIEIPELNGIQSLPSNPHPLNHQRQRLLW